MDTAYHWITKYLDYSGIVKCDEEYEDDMIDGHLLTEFCGIPQGCYVFINIEGDNMHIRYCYPDDVSTDWQEKPDCKQKTLKLTDVDIHVEFKNTNYLL
jgi:hypothetical protein